MKRALLAGTSLVALLLALPDASADTCVLGTYGFSGSTVTCTVAATGLYDVETVGATGGGFGLGGGGGAVIGGEIALTAGETLVIAVGGRGGYSEAYGSFGGGGGSFVVERTGSGTYQYLPLVIAGGGGGDVFFAGGGYARGLHASAGRSGVSGYGRYGAAGAGGSAGSGGSAGNLVLDANGYTGAGGAGLFGNGGNASLQNPPVFPGSSFTPALGGVDLANGLLGGASGYYVPSGPQMNVANGGGFGGGGGGGVGAFGGVVAGGGGGGGYSGGGGGGVWETSAGAGGGGGSYLLDTALDPVLGGLYNYVGSFSNSVLNDYGGNGAVMITYAGAVPEPASLGLFLSSLLGLGLIRRRRRV